MKQVPKRTIKFLSLLILTTTASTSLAETWNDSFADNFSVGAEAGTLGVGANLDWKISDKLSLRSGWTGGSIGLKDIEIDSLDFDVTAKFNSPYIGMQVRPWENWFTVNTGLTYIGSNKINARVSPTNNTRFIVDGEEYVVQTDGRIDVDVKFNNKVAPYLTLGTQSNVSKNLSLFAEIGAGYTDGYKKAINLEGSYIKSEVIDSGNNNPNNELTDEEFDELQTELANEIEDKIEERTKSSKFYPIIKVGIVYRF